MTDPNERPQRVLALAQGILAAGEALEQEQWEKLQQIGREVSRQARVLQLMDRETSNERKP